MPTHPFTPPERQDCYRGSYRGIGYKILRHAIGMAHTPESKGIWNYYVYIPEKKSPIFASLWLPSEKRKDFNFVTHDYYAAFGQVNFHGGITFYAKHGEVEGHRVVEVGCDYNHYWDQERGYSASLEEVTQDCLATIDHLFELGFLQVPINP